MRLGIFASAISPADSPSSSVLSRYDVVALHTQLRDEIHAHGGEHM